MFCLAQSIYSTPLGTKISPTKALLKMISVVARWDMLVSWRGRFYIEVIPWMYKVIPWMYAFISTVYPVYGIHLTQMQEPNLSLEQYGFETSQKSH